MTENSVASASGDDETLHPKKSSRPSWGCVLTGIGLPLFVIMFVLPNVRNAGPAALRSQCQNNLKQIALALFNYEETHGFFPPAYTVDSNGKPLHSWRTLILPFVEYLEYQDLYNQIDLSKPWNDPANSKAYKTAIDLYQCPAAELAPTQTVYLAVVDSESFFRASQPRLHKDIIDETSKTLLVTEAAPHHAVHWMSPLDANELMVLRFGRGNNLHHERGAHFLFADGSVHFLLSDISVEMLHSLITIDGDDDDVTGGL